MIEIDRLRLHLRATAAPQRLHALESRVREAMSTALPTALAGLFDRSMADAGADVAAGPLVFIDRLEFVTALNSAWDDGALGQAMARPLSTRIRSLVEHGGEGVRRFEDRAAWIAEFMLELTNGTAWRRWWFDELDGLRPLALPAALRTVILNEHDVAITALLRLPRAGLDSVVDALASTECRRVLACWADRQAAQELPLHRLWQAATSLDGKGPAGLLHAALALERSEPGCIGARTIAVLVALEGLLRWVGDASASRSDSPAPALEAHCAAAHIDSAWLAHLDAAEKDALKVLLRKARHAAAPFAGASSDDASGEPGSAEAWHARTAHGGAFVLLMVMSWLRWHAVWQRTFASCAETAALADELARSLGLAVIGRALHPAEPDAVTRDPALVQIWGIAAATQQLAEHGRPARQALRATAGRPRRGRRADGRPGALEPWLEGAARSLLAALAQRVPGCTEATHDYLRRNLLAASAGVVRVADSTDLEVTMTRPPLHVLLLIAGLAHGQAWLGPRQVRVRTEDAT